MEQMPKRKKRKTRKCLNELRKTFKGKLNNDGSLSVNSFSKRNHIDKSNRIPGADRLTLGLFHKAVRSETITRSALSEIKLKSITDINKIINNTNLKRDEDCCELHCLNCNPENSLHSCNINVRNSRKHKLQEKCDITSNKNILLHYNDKVSSNSVVYSPLKIQVTMSPMFETSENVSITASSFERSQSEDVNQFYEEFIDGIPKYLREKAPALMKHDIMKQTKDYLHNLYIDAYHCETEKNVIQCIKKNLHGNKNSMTDTPSFSFRQKIEEDPMNYIKMRYTQEQSDPCETVTSTSISSPSSTLTALNISLTSQSSVNDTPEYIYFPHKLNQ